MRGAFIVLLACACGPAHPAASVTNAHDDPPTPPPTTAPLPLPPPALVTLDEPVVCAIAEPTSSVFHVAVTDGRGAFDSLTYDVEGTAHASFAASGRAVIEVERALADGTGYVVRGFYNRSLGDVHLKRGVTLDGIVTPTSERPLTIRAFEGATAIVPKAWAAPGFEAEAFDMLAKSQAEKRYEVPEQRIACDALALARSPTSLVEPKLGEPALVTYEIGLSASERDPKPTLFYDDPGDSGGLASIGGNFVAPPPPPKFSGPSVEIVERKSGRVHVRFFSGGFRVDAWVGAQYVGKRDGMPHTPPLPSQPIQSAARKDDPVQCAKDMPLFAEAVAAKQARLGTLKKGTAFSVSKTSTDGFRTAEIDGITPRGGGMWPKYVMIREVDLEGCHRLSGAQL